MEARTNDVTEEMRNTFVDLLLLSDYAKIPALWNHGFYQRIIAAAVNAWNKHSGGGSRAVELSDSLPSEITVAELDRIVRRLHEETDVDVTDLGLDGDGMVADFLHRVTRLWLEYADRKGKVGAPEEKVEGIPDHSERESEKVFAGLGEALHRQWANKLSRSDLQKILSDVHMAVKIEYGYWDEPLMNDPRVMNAIATAYAIYVKTHIIGPRRAEMESLLAKGGDAKKETVEAALKGMKEKVERDMAEAVMNPKPETVAKGVEAAKEHRELDVDAKSVPPKPSEELLRNIADITRRYVKSREDEKWLRYLHTTQWPRKDDAPEPRPASASVRMNKWTPTTNLMMLRRMGKLLEELGELSSVASRCIIQGIDEVDPGSGKVNRDRLTEEIADVYAQLNVTIEKLNLNKDLILGRVARKEGQMAEWEALFD